MSKFSVFQQGSWRWSIVTTALLAVIGAALLSSIVGCSGAALTTVSSKTVTIWMQTVDSCALALSGATLTVSGPGINTTTAPTTGTIPKTLPAYKATPHSQRHCPENQGTCVNFSTGCTSTVLNVPATGTAQYTITVNKLPPGHGMNVSYAPCEGGPACHHDASGQPIKEIAYVTVASNSAVQAWVRNTEPDGYLDRWPNTGFLTAKLDSPILFHFFGVGATAHGRFTCDSDSDADDYMTGSSKWAHCDNDGGYFHA
jgi:hypothetical protein